MLSLVLPLLVTSATAFLDATQCPDESWEPGVDRCYRYINVPRSWKDAQKYCTSLGFAGSLAFLNNQESSNDARRAVVNAVGGNGEIPEWLWIGLTDQGQEGAWKSPDGRAADELRFRAGQPDNAGGNEHFVHINGADWDWNDIPGNAEYPFICEVEPVADETVPQCPSSWQMRGNFCYKYFGIHMNWHEAQDRCSILAVDGSLAFIGSVADNANVADSSGVNGDFWIGLTDSCHENKWTGPYGKESQYNNWLPGEPNDSWGEDCAHMSTEAGHGWNDIDCNDNDKPFVCQMSAQNRHPGRCPYEWVQRGDNCYR